MLGKRLRRGAATAVVTAGLLVVVVLAAAPADASPGLTRVTATSSHDAAASKTVSASCPAGTVALGGGGVANPTHPDDVKIRAAGVHLTDTGAYYAVTADVASDPELVGAWDLSVTAVCAPRPSGYEIRIGYSPFSPGAFKGLSATCSAGKKTLSVGGFVYRLGGVAAPELTLNGFAFVGDNAASLAAQTWRYGFADSWMDELDLVCADPLPGYAKVQNTLPSPVTAPTTPRWEAGYARPGQRSAWVRGRHVIVEGAADTVSGARTRPWPLRRNSDEQACSRGRGRRPGWVSGWSVIASW
jgi:hypothetical protein